MPDDPYASLLELPPGPRPPEAHELLGVEVDVNDPAIIEAAAARRMDQLDQFVLSGKSETRRQVQQLMNEVAQARGKLIKQVAARKKKAPPPQVPQPYREPTPGRQKQTSAKPRSGGKAKPRNANANAPVTYQLSGRLWAMLGGGWLLTVGASSLIAYLVASAGPTPAVLTVNAPAKQPVDQPLTGPVRKDPSASGPEVSPPVQPQPSDPATKPRDPRPKPQEPKPETTTPAAPVPLLTWDEIKKIQDPDLRLRSFVRLRDTLDDDFPKQVELLRLALNAFNGIDNVLLRSQQNIRGGRNGLYLEPLSHNSYTNPNAQLTDISVFTGMKIDFFEVTHCENLRDFEVLRTMQIDELRLDYCPHFSDIGILNDIEGLGSVHLASTAVSDLRPLKLKRLGFMSLDNCERITSLAGLEGMSINYLSLSGLSAVTDFSVLSSIDIYSRLNLSRTQIADLSPIRGKKMKALELNDCPNVTALDVVASLPALETLYLYNSAVPKDEVARLNQQRPKMRVEYRPAEGAQASNAHKKIENHEAILQAYIRQRDKLEPFSGEQMELVLKTINLFNGIDNARMEHRKPLYGGSAIRIEVNTALSNHPNLSIRDLSPLQGIEVRELYLSNCKNITDFTFLKTMKIHKLVLNGCEGLESLRGLEAMQSLKVLDVSRCGNLPSTEIDRIRRLLPQARVLD